MMQISNIGGQPDCRRVYLTPVSAVTRLDTPTPCMEWGKTERSEVGGEVNISRNSYSPFEKSKSISEERPANEFYDRFTP